MAYTTIDDPSVYFQTTLYTGNATNSTAITNGGNSDLQPDWLWIKNRADSGGTGPHFIVDSSRGANKDFHMNNQEAEHTTTNAVKSFNSDGFTIDSGGTVNDNSDAYVAWQWKVNGGTTSSNSDGALTSTVQVNTTAGFSIVLQTADGGGAKTIGHGLGAVPKMIITKNRTDNSTNWQIYHASNTSAPETEVIYFTSGATQDYDGFMADTAPTSSVFTAGGDGSMNGTSGKSILAYCFTEIQGYSKIGGYTGNGNADGAFVHTGFRPAWIMGKRSSGGHGWFLFDDVRDTFNPTNQLLEPSNNNAETNDSFDIDILSNGFKLRGSENTINGSGESYIYMAFARHPFVSSKGVPVTAR